MCPSPSSAGKRRDNGQNDRVVRVKPVSIAGSRLLRGRRQFPVVIGLVRLVQEVLRVPSEIGLVGDAKLTLGAELLKVHVSYWPVVQKLLAKFNKSAIGNRQSAIRAFAHITGGGFVDNIPRVLPKSLDCVIKKGSWDMLPIFKMIAEKSGVPDEELYQVFNMGIGMVSIVTADKADAVLKFIRSQKHKAWIIGEVVKGSGEARVE